MELPFRVLRAEARAGFRLDGDEALSSAQQEVDLEPAGLRGRPVVELVVEPTIVVPRAQAVRDQSL